MSTNNKWGALSMQDRAFLIREAVRNGITDINSIRDTWEHRFDGTKDNVPTEDKVSESYIHNFPYVRTALELPHQTKDDIQYMRQHFKYSPEFISQVQSGDYILSKMSNFSKNDSLVYTPLLERLDTYFKNRYDKEYNAQSPSEQEKVNQRYATWMIANMLEKKANPYNENHKFINDKLTSLPDDEIDKLFNVTYYGPKASLIKGLKAKHKNITIPELIKMYKIMNREYFHEKSDHNPLHQFSGEDNHKIQTDTEHKTDNSLIERIALNIGSKDSAKDEGYAGISDIVTGTIDALLGKTPTSNNNLAAFLGKPEDYGFEEISDTRGPQFPEVISRYADQNFKTYKGIINPYNEYVVSKEDYDKFMKMAQDGTIFYNNADWDNVNYIHQIIEGNKSTWAPVYFDHKYRDDVQNYPIQFYTKNGKLYANAADLYDFNTESWQGKMLTKKGIPYILRQNDIPVRAIDVPEELLNLHPMYYNNELTDEYKRARNIHRTIKAREEEEKN